MLETLIAFAIGSMVIAACFGVIAQASNRQAQVQNRLDLTRFARATLTEYMVTYPALSASGTYGDKWQWQVTESALPQPELQSIGMFVDYIQLNIAVSDIRQSGSEPVLMTTAVVRQTGAR